MVTAGCLRGLLPCGANSNAHGPQQPATLRAHLAPPICQDLSSQPFQLHPLVCCMLVHQSQLSAADHSKELAVHLYSMSDTS